MTQDPLRSSTQQTEQVRQLWLRLLDACAKRVVQALTPPESPPSAGQTSSTNTTTGDDETD